MGRLKHNNSDDNTKPLKRARRILGVKLNKSQYYRGLLLATPTRGVEEDITTVGCPAVDGMREGTDQYDAGLTTASGIIPPETTHLSTS